MRPTTYVVLLLLGMTINPPNGFAQWWALQKIHPIVNNSQTDELRPIVTADGTGIYFTRQGDPHFNKSLIENEVDLSASLTPLEYAQKLSEVYSSLSGETIEHPYLSSFNQDIWYLDNAKKGFATVHHLPEPLNNAFPNSICALSTDGAEAIIVNQFPKEGGIKKGFSLIRKESNGKWSYPLPITIKGLGDIEPDVNLALSDDGQYLILSIQRSDSYSHSNDLYICERIDDFTWNTPKHLGPAINSPYHEAAPFLTENGSRLFFSSTRRGGHGGSDIYFVERLGSGWNKWTAPKALPAPINSASNESHPHFVESTGELFFSSRRDGSSDIFKVQIAPPSSSMVEIAGTVRESNGRKPLKAIIISKPAGSMYLRQVYESTNGSFAMKIPKGEVYEVKAQKDGYLTDAKKVQFNNNHVYFKAVPMEFKLQSAEAGNSFVLENIQFKQSTSELITSSQGALENLGRIMQENPNLVILIEGHTDNRGTKEELYLLSEERANTVKKYLENKYSIAPERINTEGVGDSQPLNANIDEKERSINRRVEVKIMHSDYGYTVGTQ